MRAERAADRRNMRGRCCKAHTGVDVVVKHENHTPIGAFKVRGGLVYFDRLKRERPQVKGIVTATRGNHGQSLAFAGARAGVPVTIVVPHGNSTEKNGAMRALGAELIEHGRDFDEAKEQAVRIAAERGLEFAPSFHRDFVVGVATYAHELFTAVDELDTVYVPIGLGSGICGVIGMRDLLGCKTRIVGVVSYGRQLLSPLGRGRPRRAHQLGAHLRRRHGGAGAGCGSTGGHSSRDRTDRRGVRRRDRRGDPGPLQRHAYLRRGRGAAPLAALMKERDRLQGRRVAVIVSGQNIDRSWMQTVLAGGTPRVG